MDSKENTTLKSKVCFLLTHIPNPRMNKRINVYKENYAVSVLCIRRKSQNIWEPQIDDINYYIYDMDLPSAKHLIKRAIMSGKYQKVALEKLKEIAPERLYCGGLDSLIIANKYKKNNPQTKVIYEVADLREAYITTPKNILKRLANGLVKKKEKKALECIGLLVVTSPQFYNQYYCQFIPNNKMIFIPNAPNKMVFENYKKKSDGRFTIGFIGGIRYLKQMKMLVDAACEMNCDVFFAGAGGTLTEYEEITTYCKDKSNVSFSGRYDYEKDISRLYGQVDCVFAVYDASNPNVRIALPNKLYESIVCGLPIIVAKNTYLSELVNEWGVGVSVKHDSVEELKIEISKLMNDQAYYDKIVEKCNRIKKDVLTNDLSGILKV
ncbi:MAG: glycosyltransferase [Lachnospiraceae bacterium]|nr:glycosyltransferase [Lachnospiraceae bacterium]